VLLLVLMPCAVWEAYTGRSAFQGLYVGQVSLAIAVGSCTGIAQFWGGGGQLQSHVFLSHL
jgi:hypothetical protein